MSAMTFSPGVRGALTFMVLLVVGYLCLATSCRQEGNRVAAASVAVRFERGESEVFVTLRATSGIVVLSHDGALRFGPEMSQAGGFGGGAGASGVPSEGESSEDSELCLDSEGRRENGADFRQYPEGACVVVLDDTTRALRIRVSRANNELVLETAVDVELNSGVGCGVSDELFIRGQQE